MQYMPLARVINKPVTKKNAELVMKWKAKPYITTCKNINIELIMDF